MEKDMKKAIVNKQKTHEAQMDPPPVLQNKFWGLGVLQEAPTESISILFWPFFFQKSNGLGYLKSPA